MGWVIGGALLAWLYAGHRQRTERRWQAEYADHTVWLANLKGTE